ncbi:carboxypeptidase inhibitor SmCI-like [Rhipicephalus microplus]|uniref:carboxypeptidase inhibitor SmCI-like n=1 Tax=Rhipicephalus microplus TaxID=6941 RepID=UPI003F6D2479
MRWLTGFLLFLRLLLEQAFARNFQIQNVTIPSVCQVSPYLGNDCKPPRQVWYYDHALKSCKMLVTGSCTTNDNQFPTKDACEIKCQASTKPMDVACLQSPITGKCSTIYYAWYFDIYSRECKMFSYLFCRKHINFFVSEIKCQSVCLPHKTPKPLCSLPPLSHSCLRQAYHWYFNPKNNICLTYLKHHCAKTNNRFKTQASCMRRCSYLKATSASTHTDHKAAKIKTGAFQSYKYLATTS